jgi:hypothetical protein
MWKLTASLQDAPAEPEHLAIEFKAGLPVKVTIANQTPLSDPVDIFLALNAVARKHGVGRIDIVENRFIGVKSRGCYESPGATILRVAHMDIEGLTLDRNVRALRDQFVTIELSRILYNGHFFTPEREFVTSAIPASQRTVNGTVRLKLYKGNVVVIGRYSDEVTNLALDFHLFLPTSRVYMTSINPPWTNLVVLSQRIPQDSSRSKASVLKSIFLAELHHNLLTYLFQGGVKPMLARAKVALSQKMFMAPASNQIPFESERNHLVDCTMVFYCSANVYTSIPKR